MVLQHLQVAPDALLDVQVDVPALAEVAAQVLVGVVAPLVVQHHAVAVVHRVAQVDAPVLVEPVARQVVPGIVQVLVALDVHRVAQLLVEVVARLDAPQVVKQPARVIAQMGVILFVVADVVIPVVERASMYLLDLHVPVVRERVVPIVITLVVWRAVPAVCLVA